MQSIEKNSPYDAFLLISFGGPEGKEEVIPFLQNVLAGKNVPLERMQTAAEHYYRFDGISPINRETRRLIATLKPKIELSGLSLPIYWGNRNWHPLLPDTLQQMANAGIKKAIAFVTSAYSSYSSCRQYQDDILRAQAKVVGIVPEIVKLRPFFNHPGFIKANADNLRATLELLSPQKREKVKVAFTAHSIPKIMADGCNYEQQLQETARLVMSASNSTNDWQLVFQSRSGPASQPWLAPDILDYIKEIKTTGATDLIVVPIGFICDHMEIIYDLDFEAKNLCTTFDINFLRVPTVGIHPDFINMIVQLTEERVLGSQDKLALGNYGPLPDLCPPNCCPSGR